jgi:molybdate transport system substrate-binding protein
MMIRLTRILTIAPVVLAGALAGMIGAGSGVIDQAGAAELNVISAGAMRASLQELAPEFEKQSGHKLKIEYGTAGGVEQKAAAEDAEYDVVIVTKPRMDKLVKEAKVAGGTTAVLFRAPIGLAVKEGAAKPDISSDEKFKQALLGAKSIAYVDPASGGTSGIHIAKVLEKLGIADQVKAKTKLISAGPGQESPRVGDAVARGEAELGIQPISELSEVKGITIVGPLPNDLQSPDLVYVAGSPMLSEQPVAAKALIDFLNGPKANEVYKSKGAQPM